jgi:hypothetical protein
MAPRTVNWQTDGVHLHDASKYPLPAIKAAAKEKGIALSHTVEGTDKRHTLTKAELISALVAAGEVFPEPPAKKAPRAQTAYNKFIREQIKRLKTEQAPAPHREVFKKAAANWRLSNPVVEKPKKAPRVPKEPKVKREPSEYNKWVAAQIKRLKDEEGLSHPQAFKKAPVNYRHAHPKEEVIFSPRQMRLLRGPARQ